MVKKIGFLLIFLVVLAVAYFIFSTKKITSPEITKPQPPPEETKPVEPVSEIVIPEETDTYTEKNPELAKCIEKARDFYSQNQLLKSQKQFEDCLIIEPNSIDARISIAGILFLMQNYARAEKEFSKSIELVSGNSILEAYCYSMLGDTLMALDDAKKAEKYYEQALKVRPISVNAQLGLAKIYELGLDWNKAALGYKRALIWDPSNIKANEGFRRVEPYVMTDNEILANLKERKAVAQDKTEISPQDKKLFYKICQSEQMGAIDYIKSEFKVLHPAYIYEKKTQSRPVNLYLTYRGFEVYRKLVSRDAIELFNKRDIGRKHLFAIRDKKGRRVFDPKLGLLTYDGFNVYYKMLEGETPYILSSYPIGVTDAESEKLLTMPVYERSVIDIKQQGYEEITQTEYIWIREATNCSEATLERDLDVKIIRMPKLARYFIDKLGIRKDQGALMILVIKYRKGDFSTDTNGEMHRTFFGTGQQEQNSKICKPDGTLNIF